jgi:hypothetical protein
LGVVSLGLAGLFGGIVLRARGTAIARRSQQLFGLPHSHLFLVRSWLAGRVLRPEAEQRPF